MTAEEKAQKFGCAKEFDHMPEDLAVSQDALRKAECSAHLLNAERFTIPPLPGYKSDTSGFSQPGHHYCTLFFSQTILHQCKERAVKWVLGERNMRQKFVN